ncbi:MAG TPA: TIGR03546 family protein [Planctomycetota bacterium]|nr:TIGR03546 family protein [Planctomycetota bacterium]
MFVLTITRKLYKVLSSDASPTSIAFAVAFGVMAGSVPVFSGFSLFLLMVILIFRVQLTAALLAWGLVRLASVLGVARVHEALGERVLEAESAHAFWTWFLNLPIVGWFGFERYVVVGGALTGILLGAALFLPVRLGVIAYRRWAHQKVSDNKFFRWLTNFWIVKALRFVFLGASRL